MVHWTGPGLRIRLPDLASASESETGVHHALSGKELGKAKGARQEKCDDLCSHRTDRFFSPKSQQCWFECCRCWGPRCEGVYLPADTRSLCGGSPDQLVRVGSEGDGGPGLSLPAYCHSAWLPAAGLPGCLLGAEEDGERCSLGVCLSLDQIPQRF